MRIKLAGFNIDSDIMRRLDPAGRRHLTPETLSAAYARISRSPLAVDKLRKQACRDVEQARRSNQKIIFEMGHHSVAEHAVFNFDLMGVSRLALEEVERFRLASYTEKSQRYVTLAGDFVMPAEIRGAALRKSFREIVRKQNRFYFKAFDTINRRLQRQHQKITRSVSGRKLVEGWAKEDARYILPLAAGGQVGMTVNARTLEHMLRRWRSSSRAEVRQLAEKLYALVLPIAPSIILFPEPTAFDRDAFVAIDDFIASLPEPRGRKPGVGPEIVLLSENADDLILASRLAVNRRLGFARALAIIGKMEPAKKRAMFEKFFAKIQFFSAMPREFEMADVTFEATVSAANFAQLKRHRMASLLSDGYAPELGVTLPASINEAGLDGEFLEIIREAEAAYGRIREVCGDAADYVLTNAHRRRVLVKMNLREIYHFIRLRDDAHAQWDIRQLAHSLAQKIKKLMPLTAMMLCGKSDFDETYKGIGVRSRY